MGSETPLKLPMIDFSTPGLKPGTPEWTSVKTQVQKALEQYGCFEVLFDKVPLHLRKGLFDALKELFDLPFETKCQNVARIPYHGYVGQNPKVPLYESFGVDEAPTPEKAKAFTDQLWPQGNENFSKIVQSYSEQLSELDQTIRRMIVESYGIEKYLEEHLDSTYYLLRVMKYKGPQTDSKKPGLHGHTDKNMLTILYQDQVEGLGVQTKDGEWIDVKPSQDSFVAMVGDSLHAWTNGRLYPPYHRVLMRGNKPRYSAGLFSIPREGYMIKAPEELVDEEHPLLFKPFDHVEFLGFYYTEAGLKAQAKALKLFCGV